MSKKKLSEILEDLMTDVLKFKDNGKVMNLVNKWKALLDKAKVDQYTTIPDADGNGYEVVLNLTGGNAIELDKSLYSIFDIYVKFEGKDDDPPGEFSFFISEKNEHQYLDFKNVTLALGFDNLLLKSIDGKPSEIKYQGGVRIKRDLSIELENDLGFSFSESRIGNTGIIIGFYDKFYLDQSPLHTPRPLKDKLGLADEFIGVYFDKMTLVIEEGEFLEGFPRIETQVTEAAFGNNGASFDLQQNFDVDEQNLSNALIKGSLLFEDLKYAFKYIDLSLRNHKVEKLDFEGFIQIPVLNNPILSLTFNFKNVNQNDKRLAYTITKDHALDDIEIAGPGRFFWIKIKYLELSGLLELSDNRKKITMESPAVEATVGVEGKNDMPFSNARAEIKRTEEEAVFSVEIEELELEGFYFKDAKFLSKKKKNEQLEIGLSGHVKIEALDEAEIKLDLSLTKYDAGGHTFKYELEKKSEDDIVISLEDIFTLTIEELHAKGTIDKKKNETYRSLTGKLSGSLDLLNGDVAALNGADIEIKESAAEKIISIKLDDFNFITQELVSADLTIREATFYSIKYKEQAPEEGEEEKKEDEAYIELTLDLAASAIDQLVLPPHLDSAELKLDSKFKYAWKGDDRSLKSTSELTDITFINKYRDFIPAVFRPEVQSARLSYEHDWEKGNFQFKDGKIVVGISGEVKIKALEEAAISFDFAFINYHDDGHTFTYKGKKKGEDDIVLSLENFYTLTIKKLNFDGSIDKKETGKYHNLEGALSGSLELLDGNVIETVELEEAEITIKESSVEKIIAIELKNLDLDIIADVKNADLTIDKAVFYSARYLEQETQGQEQDEEEKKTDEAYIELDIQFKEANFANIGLEGFPATDFHLDAKLKYAWKGVADYDRSLKGSLELKNPLQGMNDIADKWDFIPENFRPEIHNIIVSYHHKWNKGKFAFEKNDDNKFDPELGCLFSIDSLIQKIPFHELIDVRTGDEDGNIKAELTGNEGNYSLSILNAAELHFFLPGDSHSDEPLIVNDINEIAIKQLADGRSNFEISGEVDLLAIFGDPEPDPNASQNNKINAKISIDKLAYRFGVYGALGDQEAEVYFAFGGQAEEDVQDGAEFLQMAPGGIDGFIKKIFNGQDMGADSLSESEQVNELSEDTEEETKETKQVILENKKLGKLTLDLLKYEIPEVKELLEEKELSMYVKADVSADLGPFYAKVSGLGLKAWLTKSRPLTQRDILLGKFKGLDLKFGVSIVPPTKATFKLEAKAVSGGGHLEFDYDNHRYAGILALKLKVIDLTAVGLITTRLPNNKPGFSMLISISVIFNTGIQLSFGFTLKGVGGLIGVHRTFKIEALRSRFASGSINSIMFPQDPIKNADKIISDLRAIFPPQEKHYVAAPFLKIGWSKFVELDIGVLLEFPFKGRLILLGSVGLFLPERNNPIVELHIDVLGDFNFAEKYIRIEGILRDSRIKDIPVYGGFAFFLSWDGKPKFLFSAGGYHPRYKKPARFPDVPRVGTVINYSDKLSLTCEFYTAVTSNSFQTGFKADFLAKFSGAEIKGYLFFDALLYFRPFYFEVEIGMGVSVKYKKKELAGADLYFMLSGPKPWKAIGRAEFKFSVFSLEVDFSHTWGGSQPVEQAPSMAAHDLLNNFLVPELIKTANWTARLPENLNSLETLRSLNESEQGAVLHPCGYLEVRQQVVPLDRSIEKYGQAYVTGSPRYSITNFKVGGVSAEVERLKEYFSRGQFEDLTDEEKISSPDFELMNAGLRLDSADDFDMSASVAAAPSEVYEDVILQSGGNARGASLREKAGGGINIRPVKIEPIRVDPGRPVGVDPGVQIGGGKTPVVPVSVPSRKKGKRTWKTDRYFLNRSGRRRRFDEQPEQSYRLTEPDLFFPETEEYAIKGRGLQGVSVFSTYSEAKDYLNSRESVGEWQVVTAKEAGKSLANDSVSTRK